MLSIGIIGLPNVGKSTLFRALTNQQVDIQNYPFTTIDPNVGIVKVPDERLDLLTKMSHSAKTIPTAIEFIDIAGLVKGAAQGEGLGNKFLANIREVDAIAEVVRVFENENIVHVHKRIDPADDIEIINTELALADLETKQKREAKTRQTFASQNLGGQAQAKDLPKLDLLTDKKIIYVLNLSEEQIKNKWQPDEKLLKTIGDSGWVAACGTFELVLSEIPADEQKILLEEMGMKESGLDSLIKKSYETLDLITFLTTGEDETRAWTAKRGSLIPQAARAIHTDFEHLFIRAEVIDWRELLKCGSWVNAKAQGKMKTVGRDYLVQDGDVVEIKI